mmetsp:Transcript_8923/g.11523  ORF Transcript_8923/g.11523 Transcript_8923/m.11523 type:complete len:1387 (-) Transcript_8923:15-4175(-)
MTTTKASSDTLAILYGHGDRNSLEKHSTMMATWNIYEETQTKALPIKPSSSVVQDFCFSHNGSILATLLRDDSGGGGGGGNGRHGLEHSYARIYVMQVDPSKDVRQEASRLIERFDSVYGDSKELCRSDQIFQYLNFMLETYGRPVNLSDLHRWRDVDPDVANEERFERVILCILNSYEKCISNLGTEDVSNVKVKLALKHLQSSRSSFRLASYSIFRSIAMNPGIVAPKSDMMANLLIQSLRSEKSPINLPLLHECLLIYVHKHGISDESYKLDLFKALGKLYKNHLFNANTEAWSDSVLPLLNQLFPYDNESVRNLLHSLNNNNRDPSILAAIIETSHHLKFNEDYRECYFLSFLNLTTKPTKHLCQTVARTLPLKIEVPHLTTSTQLKNFNMIIPYLAKDIYIELLQSVAAECQQLSLLVACAEYSTLKDYLSTSSSITDYVGRYVIPNVSFGRDLELSYAFICQSVISVSSSGDNSCSDDILCAVWREMFHIKFESREIGIAPLLNKLAARETSRIFVEHCDSLEKLLLDRLHRIDDDLSKDIIDSLQCGLDYDLWTKGFYEKMADVAAEDESLLRWMMSAHLDKDIADTLVIHMCQLEEEDLWLEYSDVTMLETLMNYIKVNMVDVPLYTVSRCYELYADVKNDHFIRTISNECTAGVSRLYVGLIPYLKDPSVFVRSLDVGRTAELLLECSNDDVKTVSEYMDDKLWLYDLIDLLIRDFKEVALDLLYQLIPRLLPPWPHHLIRAKEVCVGDVYRYTTDTQDAQLCTIVAVHSDDEQEPYYTIRVGDENKDKQTVLSRFQRVFDDTYNEHRTNLATLLHAHIPNAIHLLATCLNYTQKGIGSIRYDHYSYIQRHINDWPLLADIGHGPHGDCSGLIWDAIGVDVMALIAMEDDVSIDMDRAKFLLSTIGLISDRTVKLKLLKRCEDVFLNHMHESKYAKFAIQAVQEEPGSFGRFALLQWLQSGCYTIQLLKSEFTVNNVVRDVITAYRTELCDRMVLTNNVDEMCLLYRWLSEDACAPPNLLELLECAPVCNAFVLWLSVLEGKQLKKKMRRNKLKGKNSCPHNPDHNEQDNNDEEEEDDEMWMKCTMFMLSTAIAYSSSSTYNPSKSSSSSLLWNEYHALTTSSQKNCLLHDIFSLDLKSDTSYSSSAIIEYQLYALILQQTTLTLPHNTKSYFLDNETSNAHKQYLEDFIRKYVSPILLLKEYETLEEATQLQLGTMSIKKSVKSREVSAFYEQDEMQLSIAISVPPAYPLHNVKVDASKTLGVSKEKYRRWSLTILSMLNTTNSNILDALLLWKDNIDKEFDGIEPCPVCYAVIDPKSRKMPTLECRTCGNRFHGSCLSKWFQSSGKSQCVLCQQPWSGIDITKSKKKSSSRDRDG